MSALSRLVSVDAGADDDVRVADANDYDSNSFVPFRPANWGLCLCKSNPDGKHCYTTFVETALLARQVSPANLGSDAVALPIHIQAPEPKTKALYHIVDLEKGTAAYKDVEADFRTPGFEVDSIVEVQNDILYTQYCARKMALSTLRGNANERVAFHVSKGSPHDICQNGLDYRLAQRGFFGKGLYVTPDPMKANDYSSDKGNSGALRMMLRCKVLLGLSKKFELGRFDRDLVVEPEGYDSVEGFIRRGTEYAVYASDRVYVTHIVFYRFTDTSLELAPSLALPPNVSGQIVYITASLSEFFEKLQKRATPDQLVPVKRIIAALLRQKLTVPEFLVQISAILKAAPPADLESKLIAELGKCKLLPSGSTALVPAAAPTAAAAASASADVQPSVPTTSSTSPCSPNRSIEENAEVEAPMKEDVEEEGTEHVSKRKRED